MISVEGVTKRFGDLVAVRNLDFQVDRGEVVGFLGPNGAGKTTTMRMLTGTLEPDEGRVLYDDVPISGDLTAAKERLGYLPETNPLYEEMLVAEYMEYAAQLRMLGLDEARSAISDAVEETGIGDVYFRPVSELSKGYRQRVGLAAAILHHPEILVLDEPTEGLDPNQRVDIRNLVSELVRPKLVERKRPASVPSPVGARTYRSVARTHDTRHQTVQPTSVLRGGRGGRRTRGGKRSAGRGTSWP